MQVATLEDKAIAFDKYSLLFTGSHTANIEITVNRNRHASGPDPSSHPLHK